MASSFDGPKRILLTILIGFSHVHTHTHTHTKHTHTHTHTTHTFIIARTFYLIKDRSSDAELHICTLGLKVIMILIRF